jgi:hypothetical protein
MRHRSRLTSPMMTTRRTYFLAVAALVMLAACSATGGSSPGSSPSAPEESEQPATSASSQPASSEDAAVGAPEGIPDEVWGAIMTDLAERVGAQVAEPTVVRAAPTTWNDGSLGCPEAGQVYTQALVDGYQVVLEVDGERFDYHVGRGTDVRLCDG